MGSWLTLLALSSWMGAQGRVLYVSPSGNDGTAVPDDPALPFGTVEFASKQLANADTLYLRTGVYTVEPGYPSIDSAPILLRGLTNVTLRGETNAEIFSPGPGFTVVMRHCSNVVVDNVTFRSDRSPLPDEGGELFATLLLDWENRAPVIKNSRFLSFGNHAISHLFGAKRSYGMVVTNCYFADGGDGEAPILGEDGAAISGISSGSVIVNNVIERCYRGIEVEGAYGVSITNVTIEGNILRDCYTFGIVLFCTALEGNTYSDIRVRNNQILRMRNDPTVEPYPRYGFSIWLGCGDNLQVSDNYVDGYDGFGGGISVMSWGRPVRNLVLTGNTVTDVNLRGIQVYQQEAYPVENALIEGNWVYAVGEEGIQLNGKNLTVRSNIIENWGTILSRAAMNVDNVNLGSSDIRFIDNAVKVGNIARNPVGLRIAPGARDVFAAGNTFKAFSGASNSPILDEGEGSVFLPKILSLNLGDETTSGTMTISGIPGKRHTVEGATFLGQWSKLTNVICAPDAWINFPIEGSQKSGARYFRVLADEL